MTGVLVDEQAEWSAALDADPAAFARIFARHRDAVFRQALRVRTQPEDAEEVAAAAFFELWRRRNAVRLVEGSVLPWLLVTTTNLARNSHRALVRREAMLARLPREQSTARFDEVDDGIVRVELVRALRTLRPADVALVTMTALDGYRVKEVAELLGLTEGAARVRLHRAHRRLRQQLGRTPADEEVTE